MKKNFYLFRICCVMALVLASVATYAKGGDGIPERPYPPRLVNDFANLFSAETVLELEDSLRAFSNQTSNQVVIVTVDDLHGFTPNQFATEIGDRWGVGQAKEDNGIVILFKEKTTFSKGEVYIATGRGLEGALPDVFCHRIIDDKMIPRLKEDNDYTAATWAALNVIMPVCRGEYNFETYQEDNDLSLTDWIIAIIIFVVIIGLWIYGSDGSGSYTSSGSSGFSSSSSSSWGGFGGGSFGGGGAGGSW